jgi:uncharacterized membrane protein
MNKIIKNVFEIITRLKQKVKFLNIALYIFLIIFTISWLGINLNSNLNKLNYLTLSENSPENISQRAKVISVIENKIINPNNEEIINQDIRVKLLEKNEEVSIKNTYNPKNTNESHQKLNKDDEIFVKENLGPENSKEFVFSGYFRQTRMIYILFVLMLTVFIIAGTKGLGAFMGLIFNILVIIISVIPSLIAGSSPYETIYLTSAFLIIYNILVSHGVKSKSILAILGVLIALFVSVIFTPILSNYVNLMGISSEESLFLQIWENGKINLKALYHGTIIIGVIGVLDDVSTAQIATIQEIASANTNLSIKNLFRKGMVVGKEHIISMINTLALAFLSISLPFFLALVISQNQPWWVILNSDTVAEEFVRSTLSSFALIFAVPLCSLLASVYYGLENQYLKYKENLNQ